MRANRSMHASFLLVETSRTPMQTATLARPSVIANQKPATPYAGRSNQPKAKAAPSGNCHSCQGLDQGSCGFAFEIVALDPATMTGVAVVANRGAPMGAATVAVEYNGELYLGTFAGDRIARTSWNR